MTSKQLSKDDVQHEWSARVCAAQVPAGGQWIKLVANDTARKSVAERLAVRSIENLEAKIHLTPKNSGHILEVEGTLEADVVQDCVVSLAPVQSHIEDQFSAWYANYDQAASFTKAQHKLKATMEMDEVQMMDESDDPEPMEKGEVDVAELVIQYLSLAINPYPKNDSVKSEEAEPPSDSAKESLRMNPFAALKNWRPKD